MHGIKETVSEKLSRLFSASPSSQTLDQESEASVSLTLHCIATNRKRFHKARPLAKDTKSLSSTLSSLPSGGFDWLRLNANSNGVKSVELLSFKWRSKSFSRKDESLDGYTECGHEYNKRANMPSHEENGDHGSTRSPNQNFKSSSSHLENGEPGSGRSTSSSSDIFKDASTPHSFGQSKPCLRDESFFISPELYQFLKSSLPNIVKGCQWVLLYSTVRHGISLRTLIRKSAGLSGHCLLIAGDMQGAVFGGLLDCPLNPTAKRKYQGTNQSFVFTTKYGEPRLFRATGANRYFYLCLSDLLALGGGANFALCLNEDLLSGTSGPCETFGNLCLAHVQEFELKNVELWGFTHASRYLN